MRYQGRFLVYYSRQKFPVATSSSIKHEEIKYLTSLLMGTETLRRLNGTCLYEQMALSPKLREIKTLK